MPMDMTPAVLAALTSSGFNPAFLVEATFANDTVYLFSGKGTLSWNGQDWIGLGALGAITVIEDGSNVQARGITLQLSGINNELLADVLQNLKLGAPVIVYLALFDETNTLIPDPLVCGAWRMDQPTIEVGGETTTLSINCESRLIDMNVPVERRYTQDDQAIDFPGDLGFQFVNSIQDQNIYWGATPNGNNI